MTDHKLYAIYDADGSLFGELAYLWGKCTGSAQCALCDLSHGWNPLGRRVWRQRGGLAQSLRWVHRDELPDHVLNQVMDELPCVILERNKRIEILIPRDALASCNGDFDAFTQLLERALPNENTPAAQIGRGR